MKKQLISLITVYLLVLGIAGGVSAEVIKAGGGGTPIDGILKPVKEPFEKATGDTLTLVFSSATLSFKHLMAGEVDIATAGQSYEDYQAALKKENIELTDPAAYVATVVGYGKIYTVTHKSNPVSKLSKEQLTGIFTGKIANWKEVGGNDAPIIVVLSNINPATNAAYRKLALNNEPYTKEVLDAGRFEDLRDKVSANPEAIGFGPGTMLNDTIKTIETTEFSRPVIFVTKGKPAPKVQKLLDYIKGDGKKYLKL